MVMSLMVCRYGTPLRKMSPCTIPRLGTEPRPLENDRVSEVAFSSRMLSLLETGMGSGVGVAALSGRKIVLKPLPANVPVNSASGPKLGPGDAVAVNVERLETSPNLKLLGARSAVSSTLSAIVAS
jgi:hypothetical protein